VLLDESKARLYDTSLDLLHDETSIGFTADQDGVVPGSVVEQRSDAGLTEPAAAAEKAKGHQEREPAKLGAAPSNERGDRRRRPTGR
jgi:hypothetical protein